MTNLVEVGTRLKEARLARGRSLEDLALETHLKLAHLQAIEAGNEDALPEPVYVKSFIRKMALAVGLSGDELASSYWQTRTLPPAPPPPPREMQAPWWIFPWLLGLALLGGLGYAWVVSNRSEIRPSLPASPSPHVVRMVPHAASGSLAASLSAIATGQPGSLASASVRASASALAAPAASSGATPARSASPTPRPSVKPTTKPAARPTARPTSRPSPKPAEIPISAASPEAASSPGALAPSEPSPSDTFEPTIDSPSTSPSPTPPMSVLRLHATQDSWVRVVRAGHPIFANVLHRDQTKTWTLKSPLLVTLGNAGGVEVTVGDKHLGALGVTNQIVKREFRQEER